MPTIYAQDHEFAAASGDNIDVTPSYSYFDHPPNSTSDLTITSNSGDDQPFLFETGETYDLTWSGHGGGIMEDAVVIRSDYLGPGQGAIVFEGINSVNGEPFQMVWTPGFDLEQWYWDNGGGPSSPNAFYTSDQNTSDSVQVACYAPGTEILTNTGNVPVECLEPGDEVVTADRGVVPIRWVTFGETPIEAEDAKLYPIEIKAGALGPGRPARDLIVSAQHRIVVGAFSQLTHMFYGPAMVPAVALIGQPGVRAMRGRKSQSWAHFSCDQHEVIFANGCASESLLLGPMLLNGLPPAMRADLFDAYGRVPSIGQALNGPPARKCLTVSETWAQLAGKPARIPNPTKPSPMPLPKANRPITAMF